MAEQLSELQRLQALLLEEQRQREAAESAQQAAESAQQAAESAQQAAESAQQEERRRREAAESAQQEERRRREAEEQKTRSTTLPEFLDACHVHLYSNLTI